MCDELNAHWVFKNKLGLLCYVFNGLLLVVFWAISAQS